MWADISNILWQVRRCNFVVSKAYYGRIDPAHFIVSAQNSTYGLSFCFKLKLSKLKLSIKKITTLNQVDLFTFILSASIIERKWTHRKL
jgi:hypothetical protein